MSMDNSDKLIRSLQIRDYCAALERAWQRTPELRLGQIMVNLAGSSDRLLDTALFYVEDRELLQRMAQFCNPTYPSA